MYAVVLVQQVPKVRSTLCSIGMRSTCARVVMTDGHYHGHHGWGLHEEEEGCQQGLSGQEGWFWRGWNSKAANNMSAFLKVL